MIKLVVNHSTTSSS